MDTDTIFYNLYRTGKYPAFSWMFDVTDITGPYWAKKWRLLSEIWDKQILKEMYSEFKTTKWNKMNLEIYNKYHKEEIKQRHKENYNKYKEEILQQGREYREKNKDKIKERRSDYIRNRKHISCICGGSYVDIPSEKNRHLKTQKHNDFVNKK